MTKVILKPEYSRRYPDPLSKGMQEDMTGIDHHVLLCKAVTLPDNLPLDPNPRAQKTDRGVYKEVKQSLLSESDPTFHLKNKGITMVAHTVNYSAQKDTVEVIFDEGDGIVDGGHTYRIVLENKEECPDSQYVKFEILTGVPRYMVEPIARGLNTALQVQEMSLANLAGQFDWIKDTLADAPYANEIAYRENEKCEFDIREIVALLTLFNIDEFPDGDKHPRIAYTSKAACLELYTRKGGKESYKKLRPLIKDILYLHDYIHLNARPLYNKKYGGRGGRLAFYQTRKRGEYSFPFAGEVGQARLYDGALYPILGAFRFLVEEKQGSGVFSWKTGSMEGVKQLFDETGGGLLNSTKITSDSRGKNPNAIGKDENHWDNLFKTVALAYLQKTIE